MRLVHDPTPAYLRIVRRPSIVFHEGVELVEVLQEPADLVEVWEHDRAIMQENGSKDR